MIRRAALEKIAQMLEIPDKELHENLTPTDVATWDSLGQINILAFLDREFDIQLTEAEMARITTLGSVLDIVEGKGKFNSAAS